MEYNATAWLMLISSFAAAMLSIARAQQELQLSTKLIGLNTEVHDQATGGDGAWESDTAEGLTPFSDEAKVLIADLIGAQVYRYPSGNEGNFWNYSSGKPISALNDRTCPLGPMQDAKTKNDWNAFPMHCDEFDFACLAFLTTEKFCQRWRNVLKYPARTFTPESFVRGYAPGHSVVWNLNVVTVSLEQNELELRQMLKNGVEVRYLECGNEFYLYDGLRSWNGYTRFDEHYVAPGEDPSAVEGNYMKRCSALKDIARKLIPNVRVAVQLQYGSHPKYDSDQPWNPRVYEYIEEHKCLTDAADPSCPDAFTLHTYSCQTTNQRKAVVDCPTNHITEMEKLTDELVAHGASRPNVQYWITEIQLHDSKGISSNAATNGVHMFIQGAYIVASAIRFLTHPNLEIAVFHEMHKQYGDSYNPSGKNLPQTFFKTGMEENALDQIEFTAQAVLLSHLFYLLEGMEVVSIDSPLSCVHGMVLSNATITRNVYVGYCSKGEALDGLYGERWVFEETKEWRFQKASNCSTDQLLFQCEDSWPGFSTTTDGATTYTTPKNKAFLVSSEAYT